MALSDNKAVNKAYETRKYVDPEGQEWRRGMDGWFLDFEDGGMMLVRHHDFVEKIKRENPEG